MEQSYDSYHCTERDFLCPEMPTLMFIPMSLADRFTTQKGKGLPWWMVALGDGVEGAGKAGRSQVHETLKSQVVCDFFCWILFAFMQPMDCMQDYGAPPFTQHENGDPSRNSIQAQEWDEKILCVLDSWSYFWRTGFP